MVRWQARAAAGLLVTFAMTLVALLLEGGAIVGDVTRKTAATLEPEATSWAAAEVNGRDVRLAGAAPSEEARQLAVDRVSRQFGVRSVDTAGVALLPEAIPYSVRLERSGGILTISGSAPSAPERRRMIEAFTAAVPNLAYNDRLTLARGMPDKSYPAALAALYPILGELSRGAVELTDQSVTIRGEAASNASYERLRNTTLALPAGYRVAGVDLVRPTADPYRLSASFDGDLLSLSGFAPDAAVLNDLFGAARTAAGPAARTAASLDLASGEPQGYATVAQEAVGFLGLMAKGRLEIVGARIVIDGEARTPEAYRTLEAHLGAYSPDGYEVEWSLGRPVVTPFTLSAVRAGDRITVTGFVPDEAVQAAVAAAAEKAAGLRGAVVETTLANGAPNDFEPAATYAIGLLAHLSEGGVTVADGRISLTGVAKTGADLLDIEAQTSAESAPAGFSVAASVTPPVVRPYVWTMEKTAEDVILSGSVPSEDSRTLIREVAEDFSGDRAVADRTTLAGGLPAGVDLEDVATFAATQLSRLETGTATLRDDVFSLSGRTTNGRAGAAVSRDFRTALPAGVQPGDFMLDAPPALQFRIERGLDALTIEGTVPEGATQGQIAELVARAFGASDIEMTLDPVPDLPEGTGDAIGIAIRAASLLATGEVTVEGPVITVKGRAFTGVGATRLSSDIAGAVPRGFRLDTSVGVAKAGPAVPPAECQALFDEVLKVGTIHFATASAEIAQESHGLVDRLAAIAARCPDARLVVEGHTDTEGDPASNRTLSKARADAVVTILTSTGIDPARLTAEGFGSDRPVADNGSPEGRAQNRRIEIRVAVPPAAAPAPAAAPDTAPGSAPATVPDAPPGPGPGSVPGTAPETAPGGAPGAAPSGAPGAPSEAPSP